VNSHQKTSAEDPAWNFLLAAISEKSSAQKTEAALAKVENWDAVVALADKHGVFSLAYQKLTHLQESAPAAALAAMRQNYERNVHKSLFLTRELFNVLDCLAAEGIEAMPYKGIVMSEVYYGDMATRQSGDLDLFVRARDVARAKKAVCELGFVARNAIPEAAEAAYIAAGYECTFDSPAGKNLLELQWALQPRFYSVNFDMEGLFRRAVEVNVAGRQMKTPSAEDLLLVLSLHAAKHVWGRLIWLCDIAQILHRELNWQWVRTQARELGAERILHVTLLLANQLLGLAIPATMADEVRKDRAAQRLAEQIAGSIASRMDYEAQKLSYFRLMMKLRERRTDQLRFLSRLAFTPGPGEWEAVRLPRAFFPVYRVVRMARLLSRMARH
jgi:hypothetical protein